MCLLYKVNINFKEIFIIIFKVDDFENRILSMDCIIRICMNGVDVFIFFIEYGK